MPGPKCSDAILSVLWQRTGGGGLTEDPAHVKQGGQLPRLLGIQVIYGNDQSVTMGTVSHDILVP